jgi:hypothetical protein
MSTTLNRHDAASGGGRTPRGNSQYLLRASARTRPTPLHELFIVGEVPINRPGEPTTAIGEAGRPARTTGTATTIPGRRSRTGGTHPSARRPASPASTYPEVPAVNLTAGDLATPRFGRTIATWPRRRRTLDGNARPAMPFLMMVAERGAPPNLAMLVRRRPAPCGHVPGVRLGAGLSHGMEGRPEALQWAPAVLLGSPPRRMNHRPMPQRLRPPANRLGR